MESLISLLKEIITPLINLFGQIAKGQQTKTDRIIGLINQTKEFESKTLEKFLKEELHRKITIELKGIELSEDQLKIIEEEISKTGNKIKWFHIKTGKQYLYFEKNKLKVNFYTSDHIFNWIGFIIGMLLLILGIAIMFMDYYTDIQEKDVYIILTQLTLFLFTSGLGGFILNGTSPYFAGKRIKRELE